MIHKRFGSFQRPNPGGRGETGQRGLQRARGLGGRERRFRAASYRRGFGTLTAEVCSVLKVHLAVGLGTDLRRSLPWDASLGRRN